MIAFEDYARHDGLALGELVRRREVSPLELLEAAVARIEAHNPVLNAVVRTRCERARAELAGVDPAAPFAGVPFLIKDLVAMLGGEPTACGTRSLTQRAMPADRELVRRWRAAGLVALGRTNTPEFGLTPYTEPMLFGATRNPWALEHSPGGSSGGDGGGSIRIPASCCGLFGLKPSRGVTPTGPAFGELWRGLAIEPVVSRSVRDSAAVLDATAGADPGAPYAAPARERPYRDEVARDPGRLRIAFSGAPLFGGHVHADCLQGLQETARLLEAMGHDVEESAPRLDGSACARAFVTILAGEVRAEIDALSALLGRRMRASDFEPATYALGLLGRAFSAAEYAGAARTLQLAARGIAPFFERYWCC